MPKQIIPKTVRNACWDKYIGTDYFGKCYCCKNSSITVFNFACGHVISDNNGGDAVLTNLRPICVSCNSSMGTQNMHAFMKKYGFSKTIKQTMENNEISLDEIKDDEIKDDEIKDDETKDDEIKDDEIKDDEIKDDEIKDDEIKDDEIKDDEIKDDETKDDEIKDDEIKDDEIKDDETKSVSGRQRIDTSVLVKKILIAGKCCKFQKYITIYQCKNCLKLFNKKCNYDSHMNRKKPCTNDINPLKCNYCGKILSRTDALNRHHTICKTKLLYDNKNIPVNTQNNTNTLTNGTLTNSTLTNSTLTNNITNNITNNTNNTNNTYNININLKSIR